MEDELCQIDAELLLADPRLEQLVNDWESDINPENIADEYYELAGIASSRDDWRAHYRLLPLHDKLSIHSYLNTLQNDEHYLTASDIIILDRWFNTTKVSFELFGRALLGLPPLKLKYLLQKAGVSAQNYHDDSGYVHILRLLGSARNFYVGSNEDYLNHALLTKAIDHATATQSTDSPLTLAWSRVEDTTLNLTNALQQQQGAINLLLSSAQCEITALRAKLSASQREIQILRNELAFRPQPPPPVSLQVTTPDKTSSTSTSSDSDADMEDADDESSVSSVDSSTSGREGDVAHPLNSTHATPRPPATTLPQVSTALGPNRNSPVDSPSSLSTTSSSDDSSSDESEPEPDTRPSAPAPQTPTRQVKAADPPGSQNLTIPETPVQPDVIQSIESPLPQPKLDAFPTASHLSTSPVPQQKDEETVMHDTTGVPSRTPRRKDCSPDLAFRPPKQQRPPIPFDYSDDEAAETSSVQVISANNLTLARERSTSMISEL